MKHPLTRRNALATAKSLLLLCAAIAFGLAPVEATIYTFSLNGAVDSGFTEYYGGNPYLYELWQDPLPDMPQYYARAGDVLDVTVTLDRVHTIPASVPGTLFSVGVHFYGYSYPDIYGSSSTTAAFISQGATVFATTDATPSSSSGGTLSPSVTFYPASNTALTFDQIWFHSVVTDTHGTILNLSLAELSITRIIPVPEPAVASLLGLALLTLWYRSSSWLSHGATSAPAPACSGSRPTERAEGSEQGSFTSL